MAKATTVRFTDEMFARLDQASARTGLPVNSIVIAACLEWMQTYVPNVEGRSGVELSGLTNVTVPPRWATIRRAVEQAVGRQTPIPNYPFERFTEHAKELLTRAQLEANTAGYSYIGTEHLLLAAFGDADSHAARMLAALGVKEDAVRSAIEGLIGRKKPPTPGGVIPTSRVKKVIEIAFKICASAAAPRVGTDHVLLALATEGEGIAAHVLMDAGVTKLEIAAEMSHLTEPEP